MSLWFCHRNLFTCTCNAHLCVFKGSKTFLSFFVLFYFHVLIASFVPLIIISPIDNAAFLQKKIYNFLCRCCSNKIFVGIGSDVISKHQTLPPVTDGKVTFGEHTVYRGSSLSSYARVHGR